MAAPTGPDGARARARSQGGRERERTPAEISELKGDLTAVQVEVASLKHGLTTWTKTMEKRVEEHNKQLDSRMAEFQINGTTQLSALEKKFEDQFAAILAGLGDLARRVAHIASGPPLAPLAGPARTPVLDPAPSGDRQMAEARVQEKETILIQAGRSSSLHQRECTE